MTVCLLMLSLSARINKTGLNSCPRQHLHIFHGSDKCWQTLQSRGKNNRFKVPVCGEAGCSSSLRFLLESRAGDPVGLQGSLGCKGDDSLSLEAFLAVAALFFVVMGIVRLDLAVALGDNKAEDSCLGRGLEEAAVEALFLRA